MLEVMDELKDTPLWKQKLKSFGVSFEKELEKYLKGEMEAGFTEDSEHFNVLMNDINSIAKWIAKTQDLGDIQRLAENLNAGTTIKSMEETKIDAIKILTKKLQNNEIGIKEFSSFIEKL
tara:strand:+ start:131 stop:490 length:360 start_codon:yes stop_codon:yes gene_type:complete